jgi:lincosamide nucleotidyltransferase A/C/D/E
VADVSGPEVVAVLRLLAAHGIRAWVAGGWAVDAVAGRQTRGHRDLDLAVDAGALDRLLVLLAAEGYRGTVDELPSRAELTHPDGAILDLHPVSIAPDGSGVQAGLDGGSFDYPADCWATGVVEGETVPCLSVRQQLRFREGYPPREVDRHDVAVLQRLEEPTSDGAGGGGSPDRS